MQFDIFVKKLFGMVNVEDSALKPATTTQCPSSKETLYDYFLDRDRKIWLAWEWTTPEYIHDPMMKFSEIVVPTVDTLRTNNILSLMNDVRFLRIQMVRLLDNFL